MSHVKHLFIVRKNLFATHIVQMSADLLPSEWLFAVRSQREEVPAHRMER